MADSDRVRVSNDVGTASAAVVPGMLQLLHEPDAKKYTRYITNDVANASFSIPLAKDERPQFPLLGIVRSTSGTGCCK